MTSNRYIGEPEDRSPASKGKAFAALWQQFNTQFATEQDCLEELYRIACELGIIRCKHCGHQELEKRHGARTGKCLGCGKKVWVTSGTFFNGIRRARAWLAAIWLMEHGVSLNSLHFHKLVGIAYAAASSIFKKLTTVIEAEMTQEALLVPSSLFSGLICKRSRETPARAHPWAEEAAMSLPGSAATDQCSPGEDAARPSVLDTSSQHVQFAQSIREGGVSDRNDESDNNPDRFSGREKEVYQLLSDTPVLIDDLCKHAGFSAAEMAATLTMLELAGAATRLHGNQYARCSSHASGQAPEIAGQLSYKAAPGAEKVVAAVIKFVRQIFQGISRKYLQMYLAACWCRFDRARWCPGALFNACLQFGPISYAEIVAYVSPSLVKILPSP